MLKSTFFIRDDEKLNGHPMDIYKTSEIRNEEMKIAAQTDEVRGLVTMYSCSGRSCRRT